MGNEKKRRKISKQTTPLVNHFSSSETSKGLSLNINSGRKPCNCKNSKCLKLYCECFASGRLCDEGICHCVSCKNNSAFMHERKKALLAVLSRNPNCFRSKFDIKSASHQVSQKKSRRHNRGCNCKKSGCLKKYCECFQEGAYCSKSCTCQNCKNYLGNSERAKLGDIEQKSSNSFNNAQSVLFHRQKRQIHSHSASKMTKPQQRSLKRGKFFTKSMVEEFCVKIASALSSAQSATNSSASSSLFNRKSSSAETITSCTSEKNQSSVVFKEPQKIVEKSEVLKSSVSTSPVMIRQKSDNNKEDEKKLSPVSALLQCSESPLTLPEDITNTNIRQIKNLRELGGEFERYAEVEGQLIDTLKHLFESVLKRAIDFQFEKQNLY